VIGRPILSFFVPDCSFFCVLTDYVKYVTIYEDFLLQNNLKLIVRKGEKMNSASVLSPVGGVVQPPLLTPHLECELVVAISSLSIGGAERIVLDWANRIHPRWRVHLIVLRDREKEWSVPSFVRVTRVSSYVPLLKDKKTSDHQKRLMILKKLGQQIAESNNPACVCHLLGRDEREALGFAGAHIVPVLHNAKDGWVEGVERFASSPQVIAVSDACRNDLSQLSFEGDVSVIRHIPPRPKVVAGARENWREKWNIPQNAIVIGMIGAVKAQKNYSEAIRILKALHRYVDAYLVIVGGPLLKNGREDWQAVLDAISECDVRDRVAMPGFLEHASDCLPAFDAMLNTSHYEGLSIATLEALISKLPVVASLVGGQGEITSENLTLLPSTASHDEWVNALRSALMAEKIMPSWHNFSSYKLWTLVGLSRPFEPTDKILFVTANLNSGGAQRSLVNLAISLTETDVNFSIAVAGNSTGQYFYQKLDRAGVVVERLANSGQSFDNTEALIYKICSERIGTVCFWNLDSKVKLLVVKALGFTKVKFIDVSPGDESFDMINQSGDFQKLVAFSKEEFYERLDHLVLKYHREVLVECEGKASVIPNGVPRPSRVKANYSVGGSPKVLVNGRIDPTKFLLEILEAMRLVRKRFPLAELHVYGGAEPGQKEYGDQVLESAEEDGRLTFFHGVDFEVVSKMPDFDVYVVLGKDQGCPNALLEALACGLPAVANNDGGTKEQVINGETGILVGDCSPEPLSEAIIALLDDRQLAERLATAGRTRVERVFSMSKMTNEYLSLLHSCSQEVDTTTTAVA
jgi:glycosyltransferase involved in cell wall biosynthesis